MRNALPAVLVVALLLFGACVGPELPELSRPPAEDIEPLSFLSPSGPVPSPVTFRVHGPDEVAWVRYLVDSSWSAGESSDPSSDFLVSAQFLLEGTRRIDATGYDASNRIVAHARTELEVVPDPSATELGLWIPDVESTGYSGEGLAEQLATLGVGRVYVQAGEGPSSCDEWPAACDSALVSLLRAQQVTPLAWLRAIPEDPEDQALVLFDLGASGYGGVVVHAGPEFEAAPERLHALVLQLVIARTRCTSGGINAGDFPILVSIGADPSPYADVIASIEDLADAWVPRIAADPAQSAAAVQETICALRSLGVELPVRPVIGFGGLPSTADVDAFLEQAGVGSSLAWTPSEGELGEDWSVLDAVDWNRSEFAELDCP